MRPAEGHTRKDCMPEEGEIHLWARNLDHEKFPMEKIANTLSREELEHGREYIQDVDRIYYYSRRLILREILARYADIEASQLRFSHGAHGKPYLDKAHNRSNLQFSLSFSRPVLLIAVTKHHPIGADIERIKPDIDFKNIARRFYSKEENEYLQNLEAYERIREFFRIWTMKEAHLKATGVGLSKEPASFTVPIKYAPLPGIDLPGLYFNNQIHYFCLHESLLQGSYKATLASQEKIKSISILSWLQR